MGTRSLTHIKDQEGRKTLLTIYRQMDGYPTGMGQDLKDILAPLQLVNGYNGGNQANGMGCAAAQIIAGLKDGVGGIYVYPTNSKDCWEDYVYTVRPAGETFRLTVAYSDGTKIYDGLIADFDAAKVEAQESEDA